ncbi:SNF1 protein kinase subunit beta-3 [Pleurostoma richardsiae]|uniref:SNF1 protein kinase subunit beta-3 n=1 Tax=Pleurostoma richardsiae TaxID=41990 RepID=A0AA38RMY2_9PEZI|nr:SNF1 protein kinase subunit beta-3 [Pleurostoma richardsiae]
MGNSPSTPRSATPASSGHGSGHDSPRHPSKRDSRHPPIPIHNHKAPAPPEPSKVQAQGSTAINRSGKGPQPPRPFIASSPSATPPKQQQQQQQPQSEPRHDQPSKPVDVPNSHQPGAQAGSATSPTSPYTDMMDPATIPLNSVQDMSYLTRPPRLPLPIEEEVHTPGSPIIAPADIGEPIESVDGLDSDSNLPRRSSTLSNTTVDDEDAEELRVDKTRPTVPTRLEWRGGGEKVYVTGTIFQWNRKQRLHPVEGQPGVFATTINILPGTHHIRFLVDNNMQTSPDLPTTVDFGNNLVNYIEVNPDDVAAAARKKAAAAPEGGKAAEASLEPARSELDQKAKEPKGRPVPPTDQFIYEIPKYLVDFDQPEESLQYQNAVAAIEKLPTPPSLPGFLGKPILNASVLIKDDNSVLNMPNHTVLNHLATSSIKNNVLAVSATTRYKSKYVTTIVYKPTSPDE